MTEPVPRRRQQAPVQNRPLHDDGSPVTPSLTDGPHQDKGLFPASEVEVGMDAVIADGGATALEEAEGGALEKKGLGLLFWISVVWVALVILLAVFAKIIHLPDPSATDTAARRAGFSLHHIFGTDQLGRDQFSRVVYGARVSMTVGFASIFFGTIIGGALGVIAGFYRGRLETFIMGCMDVLLAFPALVLALALVVFLGQNLRDVVLAISILAIAPIARLIRSATLAVSQREFVLAAKSLGAKNFRIIRKEILPVVMLPVMSFSLIGVAVAIVAEGGLAFIGQSVPAPQPTWGSMINDGRTVLQQDPWIAFVPSIVLFITVLALNFAGDTLRSRFDVREGAL